MEEIRHTYKVKHNLNHENQVIHSMTADGRKRHRFAVKKLSPLLRGITSNHEQNLYCLNCFHSYSTENKLKKHENACKNCDYCYIEMSKEGNKILKEKIKIIKKILKKNL